ncbi:ParB/RepB/Spo0J family partition protein [Burkholderia gladioli]|uniref:ParB/RepB/Spo0J family partition protein n=1 Tax=Burkholderia gladioli TaxID=28095 RepID=UPI001641B44C|nr:ParB N-terminal domain-containing protein [Burkholderia gladioli]
MAKSSPVGRIIAVPLNQLRISPHNARPNDTSDVTELAALLRSQNQLQNLVVHEYGEGYAVAEGGRRLRAFNLNVKLGHTKPDLPVWCLVIDDTASALAASVAANSGREPMHPADEFDAFKALVDGGKPIEDVAAQFGVTPLVVRRRLLLAKVSPKLIALYRAGEMNLEQLQAFTLTDKHALQEKVWNNAPSYQRHPASLRAALTKGAKSTSNDRAARFVGLDAYEAAGGTVVRDLFGGPDSGYIADDELMQRLATEKLYAIADQLHSEGWAFVKVVPEIGWNDTHPYGRSKPARRELTEDERQEIDRLETECAANQERVDEDDDLTDGDTEQLEHAIATAQARIEAIRSSVETYSDRQKKKAGALVGVGQNGLVEIHRGMIAPPDPKVQKAKEKEAARAAAVERGEPEPAGFSEALMRKLTANRTAALAAHLLECPRVALDLLCTQLAMQTFYRGVYYGAAGVQIQLHDQQGALRNAGGASIENSKAWIAIEQKRTEIQTRIPENPGELFAWLGQQTPIDVMEILCFCTSTALNAITSSEAGSRPLAAVENTIGLDVSDWWQPTRETFLDQVPKAIIQAALEEAGASDAARKAVGAAKKAQAAELAEDELRDSGWLPGPLRGPHYSMNAAARVAPPAAKETEAAEPKKRKGRRPAKPTEQAEPTSDSTPAPLKPGLDPRAAWPFPKSDRP